MELVNFFQLMRLVIDLEEKSILTADVDSSDFGGLFDGIWVVKMILKVENCENGVSGVMIQNYGRSRQVLVLDSPESDVLFSAWNKLLSVDRRELDCHNVEVAELFGDQDGFASAFDFADVKNQDGLSLIRVQTDHGEMFFVAESDLLDLFIWALEAAYTFVVDPDSDAGLCALLDCD